MRAQPDHNFEMEMGDEGQVKWCYSVKKSISNRIKYWLFCKFFPFKIIRWDADK
ncbi:hypothetical protein LCGC14_1465130 [marine sediment metagenome]|uniref:Uncharacterized protein n=1 Tax=marine sediment metagenome TaxID=412755 RepID=A0A0F9MFV1_9ZZZZ